MDFREVIRKNNFRTRLVILTYIAIMLLVGLLVDTVLFANEALGLGGNLLAFLTLKQTPYATVVIMLFTLGGILLIHFYGHKLMLTGMNAREITPENSRNPQEKQLLNIVEELSLSANLGYTPKLYLLETDAPNAFAAGWSEKNTIIGITQGLLARLTRYETQAVLAHEVGHIIHGDSKLTLYVGILANVILTITNIFANIFFLSGGRGGRGGKGAANRARLVLLLLNMILPLITQILYLYLSRTREYMADAAAVQLTQDNQSLINALKKIAHSHDENNYENESTGQAYRSAAYIFNQGDSLFSTHPSIENRIMALEGRRRI